MSKLLNGIYVTKDIVANLSTKLFNGHDGTKVRTASPADASGWWNNKTWRWSKVPFGYMAIRGLEKLFTSSSNFICKKRPIYGFFGIALNNRQLIWTSGHNGFGLWKKLPENGYIFSHSKHMWLWKRTSSFQDFGGGVYLNRWLKPPAIRRYPCRDFRWQATSLSQPRSLWTFEPLLKWGNHDMLS